jgi:hypothetical protein
MAYIDVYSGNPTAGGTDGTAVSTGGAQTNPVAVTLDASQSEEATVKLALRCETGYQTRGNTVISFTGTGAGYWTVCDTENGTYTSSLTISSTIGATNTIFYVKAGSNSSETPTVDTSVLIQVVTKIETTS